MNDLLNKVITITSKEEKSGQYGGIAKIKDKNNLTYTVYEKKRDNTTSAAWTQLRNLPVGSVVQIAYVEEAKEYEGKGYTARTIRTFNEDIGNGVRNAQASQIPPPAQSSNLGHSGASSEASRDEFSRRLGVQGHINALLSNPQVYSYLTEHMPIIDIVKLAIQIEEEAEKQLNPSAFRQQVQRIAPKVVLPEEELSVIQQEEPPMSSYDDIAESVPF